MDSTKHPKQQRRSSSNSLVPKKISSKRNKNLLKVLKCRKKEKRCEGESGEKETRSYFASWSRESSSEKA